MDDASLEKFARLLALSKVREAQIMANPLPYLNELAQEYHALRRAAEDAVYDLSGASSFDIAISEFPELPPSMVETATMRNRKAEKTLSAALDRCRRISAR